MYYPGLEDVKRLKEQGNLVPVYREIKADLETPVSAYLKIARGPYSFLLESVEGGERLARYSFLGTEPSMVLTTGNGNGPDPLSLVADVFRQYRVVPVEGLPRFHGGMVGYLSYEVARYFEQLPAPDNDPLELPEARLMLADTLLVFDHLTHSIRVVSHARLDGDVESAYRQAAEKIDRLVERLRQPVPDDAAPGPAPGQSRTTCNVTQPEFESVVNRMKQYIYDGDIIQAVPSLRLERRTGATPFAIYRALRSVNPSPYMYYLHLDDFHIVGASPELLVRVEDGIVSNHPIAGTRPRSRDAGADRALGDELQNDEKERAEHLMLVDLSRNDVGRISRPGTVEVTQFILACDAPGITRAGRPARRTKPVRRAAGLLPGGHRVRRAQDSRHANNRRAGA
jgi:anthranilate synthase component 1